MHHQIFLLNMSWGKMLIKFHVTRLTVMLFEVVKSMEKVNYLKFRQVLRVNANVVSHLMRE
jgi:hypothetical protein